MIWDPTVVHLPCHCFKNDAVCPQGKRGENRQCLIAVDELMILDVMRDFTATKFRNQQEKDMRSEAEIEKEIQNKGLTAPRLTPEHIDKVIISTDYHVFSETCLTVCCLTLKNGFTVTGESACASPENFNAELGQRIAFQNARDKIWPLEGYLLRQRLYEGEKSNEENG